MSESQVLATLNGQLKNHRKFEREFRLSHPQRVISKHKKLGHLPSHGMTR